MTLHWPALLSLAFILLFSTSQGQKFSVGNCPSPLASVATPALALTNLAGTWREYARTLAVERVGWRCATYVITTVTANTRFSLQISARKKLTGLLLRSGGNIDVFGNNGGTATAQTFFTISLGTTVINKDLNYFIIALDNANPTFMALYACDNVAFGKVETVVLLVKDTVTVASLRAALTAVEAAGFPATSLKFNFQSDCVA